MTWIDSIKRILSTPQEDDRAPESGYEVVAGDEGDELVRSTESLRPGPQSDKAVYFAFWCLGAGVLLSWNALICTFPLMTTFFPEGSTRNNLASYLGTVYCLVNFLCLGLAQKDVTTTLPSRRLHLSLILLLVTFLLSTFPVLPILASGTSTTITIIALMAISSCLAIACAYLQSAVFALSSLWGSKQTLAVMSGQGGIAMLVAAAQLIMAMFTTLGSSEATSAPSLFSALGLWGLSSAGAFGCMAAHRYLVRHPDYALVVAPVLARRDQVTPKGLTDGISRTVFRKNWRLELAVALVFIVTLSVFPPITSTIVSVRNPPPRLLQPSIFIPLHFLLFNFGDYIGRTFMPVIPALMITNQKTILGISLLRLGFIPLFAACNVNPGVYTPLINSDLVYFFILLCGGLSNGWVSSLSMIVASSPALNPHISDSEKDVAGTLAAFSLVGGLLGGSLLSFAVNWMARGNPFSSG